MSTARVVFILKIGAMKTNLNCGRNIAARIALIFSLPCRPIRSVVSVARQ